MLSPRVPLTRYVRRGSIGGERVVRVGVVTAPRTVVPVWRVDVGEPRTSRVGEEVDVEGHAEHGGQEAVALDDGLLATYGFRIR